MDLIYKEEVYAIQGACFEVYRETGCGFLEAVYQEALGMEFESCGVPYQEQIELHLKYKNRPLKQTYKPDFVCFGEIIVEIKAVSELTKEHEAQLMNYLKVTGMHLGLLVNFGHFPKVEIRRFAL